MAMRTLSELVWLVAVLTAMGTAFGVTGVDSDAVNIPTFTVQEDGWLSDTIATKFKAALMAHPRRLARSQADEVWKASLSPSHAPVTRWQCLFPWRSLSTSWWQRAYRSWST